MKGMLKGAMRDEKGKVLIMVLVLLVLGGLIIPPLLGLMSTGLASGQVYEKKTHEYYAADAGVEDAIWKLLHDVDELPNSSCGNQSWSYNYTIADGINNRVVDITIEYSGVYTHNITSIATSDDGSSTTVQAHITLDVEISEGEDFLDPTRWIDKGEDGYLVTEEDEGNIYASDGNIIVDFNVIFGGDLWAESGNVELYQGATVEGAIYTEDGNVYLNDGTTVGTEENPSFICVENQHDVTLYDGATVWGDIYCHQKVEVNAGAVVHGNIYGGLNEVSVIKGQVFGYAYYLNDEHYPLLDGGSVFGIIKLSAWPGCPFGCATTTSITGVDIGSWQIS